MPNPLAVLIVEDSESDAQLIARLLTKAGYTVAFERVETTEQMRAALEKQTWEIVISDFRMPELDGYGALQVLQETGLDIPFIVVSGTMGEETAVEMMKAGAHDYVMKGNLPRLVPAVERELKQAEARRGRKQAEIALRESEEKYRLLAENATDVIWVLDVESNTFCYMSPSVERLRGYTADEVIQQGLAGALTPAALEYLRSVVPGRLERFRQGQIEFFHDEIEQIHKDGHSIWTEANARYVVNRATGRVEATGVTRDITARKRSEDALRESEERFKAIANYAVSWESWFGPDGKYIWVNPGVEYLTGYSAQEILAMPDFVSTVVAEEDRPTFIQRFQEAIHGSRRENFEFRYLHKNGVKRWLSASWQPIYDAQGNPLGTRSSGYDITERKQAEEALQESEIRLSTIFKNDPTGLFIVHKKTRIIYDVNDSALKAIGLPKGDVVGKVCHKFVCPAEIGSCPVCDLGQTADRSERVLLKPDGTRVPILKTVVPITLKGENYLLESFTDITERKQAEDEIKKQLDELQRWHNATLGREMRVLELKREVNELLGKANQPPRYPSAESQDEK